MARLRWTIGVVIILLAFGYVVGGRGVYPRLARQLRARIHAMLEPPTQTDLPVVAVRDSVDAVATTKEIARARAQMPLGDPARPGKVALVIGFVLVGSLGLMFL